MSRPRWAVRVRAARPEEYGQIGELTARVYRTGGFVPAGHPYLVTLRDVPARAAKAELLVAEDGGGRLLGTVTFTAGGTRYADPAAGPGEASFRMLVVDPAARGHGVGEALVRACLDRAAETGARVMRLSTQPEMLTAQRLYERLGFTRTPGSDWSPVPGMRLITYALALD